MKFSSKVTCISLAFILSFFALTTPPSQSDVPRTGTLSGSILDEPGH
ncbi:hypothetical protein GXN76_04190 [Kroppenstedtia pulmonis]|uniref:Uncharacterized protein n=1 Tax=Kroppenstedtia pulmonis TaxID=1380685 RepID=A0A7D4BV70_9BACL|nr:hypothetical protein [Kroppenstedtia pulmonis]QKG83753.1 hypothetical protein GXN76_04190 [Kroppenstedtia pulmonis]